jgi:hypothetical protein
VIRIVVVLAVLLLAACGGDGDGTPGGDATWNGPAELRPRDGTLDVEAFHRYADATDADWERDPEELAREFLRVADSDAEVDGSRVFVTRDNLEDDSIRAERWVLELEPDGERWRLVGARWEQQCHVGRGHQAFSAELCV